MLCCFAFAGICDSSGAGRVAAALGAPGFTFIEEFSTEGFESGVPISSDPFPGQAPTRSRD